DETCCGVYSKLFGSGYFPGVRQGERWKGTSGPDEIWRCSIDKLPDEAFEGADMWTMSPPCQPFTRTGKRLDIDDRRSAAFKRLMEALPKLKTPPKAILVENVPEFMGSKAHKLLEVTLSKAGFKTEEFVLDPIDYGFPNSRRRFYCAAVHAGAAKAAPGRQLPGLPG
ncbi:unnamed protein product, partial [Polarella glacialis]